VPSSDATQSWTITSSSFFRSSNFNSNKVIGFVGILLVAQWVLYCWLWSDQNASSFSLVTMAQRIRGGYKKPRLVLKIFIVESFKYVKSY
jgi:hypothetical protein